MQSSHADSQPQAHWLRGPNRYFAETGVVLALPEADDAELDAWLEQVARMRQQVGWLGGPLVTRRDGDGVRLALEAPADQLALAARIGSAAWRAATTAQAEVPVPEVPAGHPALEELVAGARLRGLPVVYGEQRLGIGLGAGAASWALEALPASAAVPWSELHPVPSALLAGSDAGARLLAAMLRAHGWHSGERRRDGLYLDAVALDDVPDASARAARRLLREPGAEAIVIVVDPAWYDADGLPLRQATAALIESAEADPTGAALDVLPRALDPDGTLVLPADDPRLAGDSDRLDCVRAWFAAAHGHPLLQAHRDAGGATCGFDGDALRLSHAPHSWTLGRRGGAAARGIEQAQAPAIALTAHALGVDVEAIREVLARPLTD